MKTFKSLPYFWQLLRLNSQNKYSGFTLLELIVTVVIASILATISYPMVINQIGKARVSEARSGLGAINRAQEVYLFEYSQFATTIADLAVDFNVGQYQGGNFVTKYYIFSVQSAPLITEVHHLAQPISADIYNTRHVVSAVFHQPTYFDMVICQADLPNSVPTIVDPNTCNNGYFLK